MSCPTAEAKYPLFQAPAHGLYYFFVHFIAKQKILGKWLKLLHFTFIEKIRNVTREEILKLIKNVKDSYETLNHGRVDYLIELRTLSKFSSYAIQILSNRKNNTLESGYSLVVVTFLATLQRTLFQYLGCIFMNKRAYWNSWSLEAGLWTFEAGLWTLDPRNWTLDAELQTLDPGCWTLDAGRYPQEAGLWKLDTVVDCFRIEPELSF